MSSTVCQACFLAKAKEEIIEFYDDLSICKSCMNKLGATETEQTTSPSSVTAAEEMSGGRYSCSLIASLKKLYES